MNHYSQKVNHRGSETFANDFTNSSGLIVMTPFIFSFICKLNKLLHSLLSIFTLDF